MEKERTVFPCPYCGKGLEDYESLKNHVLTSHKDEKIPGPEGGIHLKVNGEAYRLRVEPEWTLHYLIHDLLGFTGTKLFCDRGACGACTVIMEGRPVLSCMLLAIDCDGYSIETIEGIAAKKHPMIDSYVEHHAMQCGFCTPGFVVTGKALLDRNPNPSELDVREALAGNLCRCGTYPQHPKAVRDAAAKLSESMREEDFQDE
ncbi:MAG: (2Fe-2S)-binding protein [Deltaproteobacteria bacterium]|nr:(2Fe-2S)-binding protein [Deltaproteobacteria bacterium]